MERMERMGIMQWRTGGCLHTSATPTTKCVFPLAPRDVKKSETLLSLKEMLVVSEPLLHKFGRNARSSSLMQKCVCVGSTSRWCLM